MEEDAEKYLFEKMPVPKAVATLAIPTIISQVVTMIYNLADTFFVGQIGDPLMVAASFAGDVFSHLPRVEGRRKAEHKPLSFNYITNRYFWLPLYLITI